MHSGSPIVVLDSGLGGLTVVRALRALMPAEDILYFGDTARLPYGSKSSATVAGFVRQIIDYFTDFSPKHVVIACNTATALALSTVRPEFPGLQITGVIDPGAKAAVAAAGAKLVPTIGVIATEATIRSRAYDRAICHRRNHARVILRATPLLAPIIEEGRTAEDPLVRIALRQYLSPFQQRKVEILLLGCTHYPILREAIEQLMGPGVQVIDSAEQCAQDVARRLKRGGLARPMTGGHATGFLRTFVTDDPGRFRNLASQFLGSAIDLPTWVAPEKLYETAVAEPRLVRASA